jgi:hypothetical protein
MNLLVGLQCFHERFAIGFFVPHDVEARKEIVAVKFIVIFDRLADM